MFFYHVFIAVVYYIYVAFNPSDSKYYFLKVTAAVRGESWFDYYGTSTKYVEFIGYPFINYLGFSYEAVMALFAFFGFVGLIYLYVFFRENSQEILTSVGVCDDAARTFAHSSLRPPASARD